MPKVIEARTATVYCAECGNTLSGYTKEAATLVEALRLPRRMACVNANCEQFGQWFELAPALYEVPLSADQSDPAWLIPVRRERMEAFLKREGHTAQLEDFKANNKTD